MGFNDFFDNQLQNGLTGPGQRPFAQEFSRGLPVQNGIAVLDADIDEVWAKGYRLSKAPHSYFDYYFSGQDIKVSIDGIEDDPDFVELPILEMGIKVQQQKQPIYGAFSYTYDAVMRGTRIVSGAFTLATKSPDYMRRLLEKAASARAQSQQSYFYHKGLTEDDANIEQYWGKNIDPSLAGSGKSIFSVHPPFSFVIMYGVQNVSVAKYLTGDTADIWSKYQMDNPLATDINGRLVESDPIFQANRIVLDACELMDVSMSYTTDGSLCAETYSFFGRDYILPPRPILNPF